MCQALAAEGLSVVIYTTDLDTRGSWWPFRPPTLSGVQLGEPVSVGKAEAWYFRANWPYRFGFSRQLTRKLRDTVAHFDLVHIHAMHLFPGLIAGHYARKFGIPYIIQPHGALDPYIRRHHRIRKWLIGVLGEKRNLDHASALHFASTWEMEQAKSLGIKAPACVLPLAVNVSEFADLPRASFKNAHSQVKGKQLVVFLGRLAAKKGLDLLVDAFAIVAEQVPAAHLVIAGPDDDGIGSKLAAHLQRLGLGNRSTIVGMLVGRQKLDLLADADVWVLPSRDENFGIAVIEALASGLPVVITDRVALSPQVLAADAGVVVPCEVLPLARALLEMLIDRTRAERLGRNGQRLAEEQFAWPAAAKKIASAYLSVSVAEA